MKWVFMGVIWLRLNQLLHADTVTREMLAAMNALCTARPAAESSIDWENLQLYRAGLKSDLHSMYAQMSRTRQATFRKAFVTGFAHTFHARAQGKTFTDAVLVEKKFNISSRGDHPTLESVAPYRFRVEFVRRDGRLKISQLWL
ncbi:hypothetical protein IV102_35570 [bacterium]|nr:hypothetical protein [bacterium]